MSEAIKKSQSNRDIAPYDLDNQIGYLLRLASQRHAALFQMRSPDGITPTQFSALIRISENEGCSQNHLGRLAGLDVATIKGVVDRLRHKDLAVIRADPNDKRRSLISLTPKGAALIAELHRAGHDITERTLTPLNTSERRALLNALRKIS
ncbi:MAG: MarR family transcriptional regulator [Sulfitobacter sp.]